MDTDHELRRMKMLAISVIVFLFSAIFAFGELRYALWGRTTDAAILRVSESNNHRRRGVSRAERIVEYSFADTDGAARKESDIVPADWPVERIGNVRVQYIARSPGSSRLAGHTQRVWVYIFLASLAGMGFFILQFWRFYKS